MSRAKYMCMPIIALASVIVTGCGDPAPARPDPPTQTAERPDAGSKPASPEVGSRWRATGDGPAFTLTVGPKMVSGENGCNSYRARWTEEDATGNVSFSDISGTTVGCPGRAWDVVGGTKSWVVSDGKLRMLDAKGEVVAVLRQSS